MRLRARVRVRWRSPPSVVHAAPGHFLSPMVRRKYAVVARQVDSRWRYQGGAVVRLVSVAVPVGGCLVRQVGVYSLGAVSSSGAALRTNGKSIAVSGTLLAASRAPSVGIMTRISMTLSEFLEKVTDAVLAREMLSFVAQRQVRAAHAPVGPCDGAVSVALSEAAKADVGTGASRAGLPRVTSGAPDQSSQHEHAGAAERRSEETLGLGGDFLERASDRAAVRCAAARAERRAVALVAPHHAGNPGEPERECSDRVTGSCKLTHRGPAMTASR